jgi:chemotaxis protein MotA
MAVLQGLGRGLAGVRRQIAAVLPGADGKVLQNEANAVAGAEIRRAAAVLWDARNGPMSPPPGPGRSAHPVFRPALFFRPGFWPSPPDRTRARMELVHLFDPVPAAIVVGGTLLATALRAGRVDVRHTMHEVSGLLRRRFDADQVRRDLAPLANDIRKDGVFRAHFRATGDPALDKAINAMIEGQSASVLMMHHAVARKKRLARAQRAAVTLAQAADLAPVFGLAGTLISLSQLSGRGIARAMFMSAISQSVLATLYGLLLANILLAPLARAIERRAEREETVRQDLVDWIASQFAAVAPRLRREHEAA